MKIKITRKQWEDAKKAGEQMMLEAQMTYTHGELLYTRAVEELRKMPDKDIKRKS